MAKYSSSILYIFFLYFLFSCKQDEVIPDTPIPPTPIPVGPDTIPEQIKFPFVVVATVNGFLSWNKESYLYAKTINDDQEICITLHVDRISEDLKTAMFVDTLSFVPKDNLTWEIYRPAIAEDMSNQDGSKESLYNFISIKSLGLGQSPEVTFDSNIYIVKLILPEGIERIECVNGFCTKIMLPSSSSFNDSVFMAFPDFCKNDINVVLKRSDEDVVRSKRIEIGQLSKTHIDVFSLVNCQKLSLEIGTPNYFYGGGNFSGITYLGEDRYAIVDDDRLSVGEGWYPFMITLDDDCQVESISKEDYVASYLPNRDLEGIAYNPTSGTMWLVGEQDNVITEHFMTGRRTGNTLDTSMFDGVSVNSGIEAFTYNDITKKFWVTTEAGLKKDGGNATPARSKQRANTLRFQSYNEDGAVCGQWIYVTDKHQKTTLGNLYSFGVPCLCALDDGRLLVMEREAKFEYVTDGEVAFCHEKLYLVDPISTPEGETLEKTLLLEFPSSLVASESSETLTGEFANYEGMCLGPWLSNGSRVLMLVSDSQGNMSISYSLDSTPYVLPDVFLPIVLKMTDE